MIPWLVVACPGSRADELARCLGSLQHDPDHVIVVSSLFHDPLEERVIGADRRVTTDAPDFSLAGLWNQGIQWAYDEGATHVAVFASDVIGHPGSIPTLAAAITTQGWTMAGPDLTGGPTRTLPPERTHHDRVPGGCFMLDARHRLLCDERFRWWYGDDDLEMSAREVGPVGLVAGTGLELSAPDSGLDTPEKERWAVEDRALFEAKWGGPPW